MHHGWLPAEKLLAQGFQMGVTMSELPCVKINACKVYMIVIVRKTSLPWSSAKACWMRCARGQTACIRAPIHLAKVLRYRMYTIMVLSRS